MNKSKVLFLIVGMGNAKAPDYPESYLRLLRKAVDSTDAGNVILLPSGSSKSHAEAIEREYGGSRTVFIENLPEKNMEFDADECYEFFEKKFQTLFKNGFSSEDFIIDFTHGTKAMSAALYAIGMRYRVSDFHYIRRNNDKDGNLTDGETVQNFDASFARGLAVLDQCKTLFKTWQFSAARSLLENEKPHTKLKNAFERIKILAGFYSAWDRLDYKTAFDDMPCFTLDGFEKFCPPEKIKSFLKDLSDEVVYADDDAGEVLSQREKDENAFRLGNLLVDLYANAYRRIESGALEDAAIRVYRIAEMLGQACLFFKGYVSDQMPANDDAVLYFARNNKLPDSPSYKFGRKLTAEFIKKISENGDVFHTAASFLIEKNKEIESLRNTSVLIHGFSAKAGTAEEMKALLDGLIGLTNLIYGKERVRERLETALFMNNFKDTI